MIFFLIALWVKYFLASIFFLLTLFVKLLGESPINKIHVKEYQIRFKSASIYWLFLISAWRSNLSWETAQDAVTNQIHACILSCKPIEQQSRCSRSISKLYLQGTTFLIYICKAQTNCHWHATVQFYPQPPQIVLISHLSHLYWGCKTSIKSDIKEMNYHHNMRSFSQRNCINSLKYLKWVDLL